MAQGTAAAAGSTHDQRSGAQGAAGAPDELGSIIPDELVSIIPEDLVRGVWNTARTFITLINPVSANSGDYMGFSRGLKMEVLRGGRCNGDVFVMMILLVICRFHA